MNHHFKIKKVIDVKKIVNSYRTDSFHCEYDRTVRKFSSNKFWLKFILKKMLFDNQN